MKDSVGRVRSIQSRSLTVTAAAGVTEDEGSRMEVQLDGELSLAPGFLVTFAGARIVRFPHLREPALAHARPETIALVAELSQPDGRTLTTLIDHMVAAYPDADRAFLVQFVQALFATRQLVDRPAAWRFAQIEAAPVERPISLRADLPLQIRTPASLLVEARQFLWFDHDGTLRARVTADELGACRAFAVARTVEDAWTQSARTRAHSSRDAFDELVRRLLLGGLLELRAPGADGQPNVGAQPAAAPRRQVVLEAVATAVDAHEQRMAGRSGDRTPVVPVNDDDGVAPIALGLLVAYAQELDGGRLRDRYDFVPEFFTDDETLLARAAKPSIFLFSNYLWTLERNLAFSALVKQRESRGA